jgi:hypothetical protein
MHFEKKPERDTNANALRDSERRRFDTEVQPECISGWKRNVGVDYAD